MENSNNTLENMGNSNNTEKIIGALLVGAVVGGAIGLLFAPEKGSDTRRKLSAKGDELTDVVKEKFDDFIEMVSKEVETVKDKASEFLKTGTASVGRYKAN